MRKNMQALQEAIITLARYKGADKVIKPDQNTEVKYSRGVITVTFHGHLIATINRAKTKVKLSSCGYATDSTVTRLNHILGAVEVPKKIKRRTNRVTGRYLAWDNDVRFLDGTNVAIERWYL